MTDTEAEPPNESGIRKFIRGILPHWPRSSSQGGNTPIHHESAYTGNDETNSATNHDLKRKSSQLRNGDDSDDSDYEENLPSYKRQRVTVSAMRRLFAKFTLSDKDPKETATSMTTTYSQTIQSLSKGEKNPNLTIPNNSSEYELPALHPPLPEEELSNKTSSNSNNNEDSTPNMNKCSNNATAKRDTISDTTAQSSTGKRQKIKHPSEKSGHQDTQLSNKLNKPENTNKRHVDISDSEDDENKQSGNKVKRTRRLRRGLRLCTNITCYIEQVIYN
ncbi:nuclear transcription factor Y subunit gamma-like isoform X1 [Macrobrachium nipponense]|uniref:nuclear transcription factor Y subunit gamma-like isoform X1 n=1 Tax=Macrobrachium nipponense TaxID=159736 RepID=UPI0030C871FB